MKDLPAGGRRAFSSVQWGRHHAVANGYDAKVMMIRADGCFFFALFLFDTDRVGGFVEFCMLSHLNIIFELISVQVHYSGGRSDSDASDVPKEMDFYAMTNG